MDPAKFHKWCQEINKKERLDKGKQWLDKGINWFLPEILMNKKPCNLIWPGAPAKRYSPVRPSLDD